MDSTVELSSDESRPACDRAIVPPPISFRPALRSGAWSGF